MLFRRVGPPLLAACAVLFVPRFALAQASSAAAGRAAFDNASFAAAARAFDRVLSDPNVTRDDLAEAHRYLATLRAAAHDRQGAEAHAAAALALDPTATAPDGASPDVAQMFDRIRASRRSARARVALDLPDASSAGDVHAAAVGVPDSLGARLTLRCTRAGTELGTQSVTVGGMSHDVHLSVPDALQHGIDCVATLETNAGVTLDRAAAHRDSGGSAARATLTPAEQAGPSHTGLYLGVGGIVIVGVAVAVAVGVLLSLPTQAEIGAAHTSVAQ